MIRARTRPIAFVVVLLAIYVGITQLANGVLWGGQTTDDDRTSDIGSYTSHIDQYERVYGFRVEFTPGPSGLQNAWREVSGGGFVREIQETVTGTDHFQTTPSRTVPQELVLLGQIDPLGETSTLSRKVHTNQFVFDLSPNIVRAEISPVVYPPVETADTLGQQYVRFTPGSPPPITIAFSQAKQSGDQVVEEWWIDTVQGQQVLMDIGLSAWETHPDDPVWTADFIDCAITSYSPLGGGWSTQAGSIVREDFTVRCDRVELSTGYPDLDQWLVDMANQGSSAEVLRDVTITQVGADGAEQGAMTYYEAFITRYEFPLFNASESDVIAEHSVVLQPGYVDDFFE